MAGFSHGNGRHVTGHTWRGVQRFNVSENLEVEYGASYREATTNPFLQHDFFTGSMNSLKFELSSSVTLHE